MAAKRELSLRRLLGGAGPDRARPLIVSYPRSGRNWLRTMLHDFSVNPRWKHAGSEKIQFDPDTLCQNIPDYFVNRVLFLLRDPRDTVVSFFHNLVRIKAWSGDLPAFLRNPNTGLERLLVFNLGWMEAQGRFRDFAAVSYEGLQQDTEAALARILQFLGSKPPHPQVLSRVIAEQSFDEMKRREISGELYARFGKHFTARSENDNQRKVRRGVIGGYVDEMTSADQDFCEELLVRYDYNKRIDRSMRQAEEKRAGDAKGLDISQISIGAKWPQSEAKVHR